MNVFAIESSCDDTSFALVSSKKEIKLLKTFNHNDYHKNNGGVVPEIAARQHLQIIDEATKYLKIVDFNKVDAIASTYGPGLIGSLIVGSSFSKGLAISKNKKLIPINHLQAHLLSPRLVSEIDFPYLCLLVSGGNTAIVLVKSPTSFNVLGSTIDDSAGECFDKIAKAMNLNYPGGPIIEKYAKDGDSHKYILPKPLTKYQNCNFSFSGLKTASINTIRKNILNEKFKKDFSASFQYTMGEIFIDKINISLNRLKEKKIEIKNFSICGGVGANLYLNKLMKNFIESQGINFHQVPLNLCTDNAAMVGWNAIEILLNRKKNFYNFNKRPSPNTLIHENF